MQRYFFIFLLIGTFIFIPFLSACPATDEEIAEFLTEVSNRVEEGASHIQQLEKEVRKSAEDVRQAQDALESGKQGFLTRSLALDRLRKARKDHHEKSEQLKAVRMMLSQGLRMAGLRISNYYSEIEKELQALDEKLEDARGEEAEQLRDQKKKLNKKRAEFQAMVDKKLSPFADRVRVSPWDHFPEENRHPDWPPFGPGPPREGPPESDRDRMSQSSRGMMFRFYKREKEQMEQRIRNLEEEVSLLRAEIEELKKQ